MTWDGIVQYWKKSGREALKSASVLLGARKNVHALFFCHLAVEKLLKGLIVKKCGKHPAPIHNLVKLSEIAELNLSEAQRAELDVISSFNIAGRYDDYKESFRKRATGKYTKSWFGISEKTCRWLLRLY